MHCVISKHGVQRALVYATRPQPPTRTNGELVDVMPQVQRTDFYTPRKERRKTNKASFTMGGSARGAREPLQDVDLIVHQHNAVLLFESSQNRSQLVHAHLSKVIWACGVDMS